MSKRIRLPPLSVLALPGISGLFPFSKQASRVDTSQSSVFRYDSSGLTMISNPGRFFDVDWRPQGDFALLVGEFGAIYQYDGTNLTPLSSPTGAPLNGIAFSPTGDQAVIVGAGGAILVWEKGGIIDHSLAAGITFEGITWVPDGSSALAIGIENFANEEIVRWDRNSAVVEWSGPAVWPGGISYHPINGYALIIEDWGHAAIYDKTGYTQLETGYEQMTDGLNSVDWSPDGKVALITGAWYHGPFPGLKTFMEYDGSDFNALRMFQNGNNIYEGVAWKSDSSIALVVGMEGELALYHPDPAIVGNIYCDKDTYIGGEVLKLFVDLHNGGATPVTVDAFVSVSIDYAQRLWWPNFGSQMNFVTVNLPAGQSINNVKILEIQTNLVKYQKNFTWEFWILESGSLSYESVLSYDVFRGIVIP